MTPERSRNNLRTRQVPGCWRPLQAVAASAKAQGEQAAAVAVVQQAKPVKSEESAAFVEKIRLSEAEEGEFERKREELRSLIHKMWEDSKGGEGS